jgi:hypothetical protein
MGLLDAAGRLRYVAGRMWFKILPPLLQKAIHVVGLHSNPGISDFDLIFCSQIPEFKTLYVL